MQTKALTPKSIQLILSNHKEDLFVQIIKVQDIKQKANNKYVGFSISDGYAYMNAIGISQVVNIFEKYIQTQNKKPNFSVVKIRCSQLMQKNKKIAIIEKLEFMETNLSFILGHPINYIQNPKYKDQAITYQFTAKNQTLKVAKKQFIKQQQPQKLQNKPKDKVQKKVANKPIEIIQNNNHKHSKSIFPYSHYDPIGTLNQDFTTTFKILAKVKHKADIKQIINKHGKQMKILNIILVGSDHYSIKGTFFDDQALKFNTLLVENGMYIFSGGQIKLNNYTSNNKINGKFFQSKFSIIFNKNSMIQQVEDDGSIQNILQQLTSFSDIPKKKNQLISIEGILTAKSKQYQPNFMAKSGKCFKRRLCFLVDPIELIQVQLTMWGDIAEKNATISHAVVKLSNVKISDFNGKIVLGTTNQSKIEIIKKHLFNKYLKIIEQKQFRALEGQSSYQKSNMKKIKSLSELTKLMIDYQNSNITDNIWSQYDLCIKRVIQKNINWYPSCPNCRKKVFQDSTYKHCDNCNKEFSQIKYRYLLSLQLADSFQGIIANCSDQIGEKILSIIQQLDLNCNVAKYSQDLFKTKIMENKAKLYRVLIKSKVQEVNLKKYKKHQIQKILEINQNNIAKQFIKQIKSYLL